MIGSRRLLIFGGLALAAFGMLYGLHYALFVEHQTLDKIGASLTRAFSAAAASNMAGSQAALHEYGEARFDYVRQVDTHSHWIGLAMIMIVLGAVFDRVHFSERVRQLIAFSLLAGGAVFPLSVILQTYHHDAVFFKILAAVSSGAVIAALAAAAWGFQRTAA
jgi:uncharacterized membrane protein YjjP (DUF1212 family)